MKSFINIINTYSIWVAIGSLVTFSFFSLTLTSEVNFVIGLGLALGVWFIYTLDHLLDGLKLGNEATSLRHQLHYTKRRSLVVMLISVGLAEFYLLSLLDKRYYSIIALLVGLTLFHFIINYIVPARIKKRFFLKEVFIAVVVTIGFVIVPTVSSDYNLNQVAWSYVLLFFINLSNLLLFSLFDREKDKKANVLSAASFFTKSQLENWIIVLLILTLVIELILFLLGIMPLKAILILALMSLSLWIILIRKDYFEENDRYRFYGDLIYLYPIAALPFL